MATSLPCCCLTTLTSQPLSTSISPQREVQETLSNFSTNTCGTGLPQATACGNASNGQFIDIYSTEYTSKTSPIPSCGLTENQTYQWCPAGGSVTIAHLPNNAIFSNYITVNGVNSPPNSMPAGTLIHQGLTHYPMRAITIFAFWASLALSQDASLVSGSIDGTVLSAEGAPVPYLTVYAVPERGPNGMKFPTESNGSGRFHLDNLPEGKEIIYSFNPDAGYLDPSFGFNSGNQPPTTVVVVPRGTTTVEVHLPPKCAYLVGNIKSLPDEKPIMTATFRLSLARDPNVWFSTAPADAAGHFRIGVPSGAPFRLSVTAPGFQAWQLKTSSEGSPPGALTLKPGQEYILDLRLSPTSAATRFGAARR